LTTFQGIREFGLVSGIAILFAFVSMITLFPACLVLVDRRPASAFASSVTGGAPPHARWLESIVGYRKTILAAAALTSVLAVWAASGVGFDYNLLHLQAKGVESVVWEERMLAAAARAGSTAFATAATLEELQRKQEAFARLSSVSRVESILLLYPGQQREKIALIRQMEDPLAEVRLKEPPPTSVAAVRGA